MGHTKFSAGHGKYVEYHAGALADTEGEQYFDAFDSFEAELVNPVENDKAEEER